MHQKRGWGSAGEAVLSAGGGWLDGAVGQV